MSNRRVGWVAAVVAGLVAPVVLAVGPASANPGLSTSITVPQADAVGQTGATGSFTMVNTNTPPNEGDTQTVTSIQLALSCGAARSGATVCPTPDTGVFSVNSPATGGTGTNCAGTTFTVSAPDASGVVTFTPSSTVTLKPPGSATGTDRCTVNFTFSVLKVPTIDVDPGTPGVQTRSNLYVTTTNPGGFNLAGGPSQPVTVNRGLAGLTTNATGGLVGNPIADEAAVTPEGGAPAPTGTVTFNVYGPNDSACSGAVFASSTNAISGGFANSNGFVVTQPGTYRFIATYNGDAYWAPRTGLCNDVHENVFVGRRSPVGDFDGNGTTDVAVWRPSDQIWYVRNGTSAQWGAPGDLPVAGDYDGNGSADMAVYRPSTQVWWVRNGQNVQWGASGDIPVPGDYDGNGTTDIAVFRPSNGTWWVRNGQVVSFGQSGDIPVPADYDGDGKTDFAVYRPSTQVWYLLQSTAGGASFQFGTANDIPVPGDYDGNGAAEAAVFRPSTGVWYTRSGMSPQWGQSGDIPVPGDYDGNGTTDFAVFRPGAVATWFIRNGQNPNWGTTGDEPVPLPIAIQQVFFSP